MEWPNEIWSIPRGIAGRYADQARSISHPLKTVGEVRETTDKTLLSLPDLGPSSIKHFGESLGLPSRPMESGRAGRAGHAETKWLRIDPDEPVSGLGPLATSGRQKIQAGR
jgi:hypothetical protein